MGDDKIRLKVLGSGTSMGVPTLACPCAVCHSTDERDKRLRPSLLLSRGGQNVVIDTTPDFRTQALRVGLDRLDAILLTHCHADHILGFDDLRPVSNCTKSMGLLCCSACPSSLCQCCTERCKCSGSASGALPI